VWTTLDQKEPRKGFFADCVINTGSFQGIQMKTYHFRARITVDGVEEYRDFVFEAPNWSAARAQLRDAVAAASS
jgi:hypothetical protein